MRELSLQEVVTISGAGNSIVETEANALIKWVPAALGAWHVGNWGATLFPYAIKGLDIGKLGVGGATGALGGLAGLVVGKLFNDQVLNRVNALI